MAYNELNYLKEVKHIQALAQEKIDKYVYVNYRDVWKMLKKEKKFFKGYGTFLKYMSESFINDRIGKAETKEQNNNNQLDIFEQ